MSISLDDSKYSIAMAKRHTTELKRQIDEFIKTEPYSYITEIDPDTREQVHKHKLTKPMPVFLKGIASDAILNLRSALDQMMFAFTGSQTYFPFAKDARHFENAVKGKCKNLPDEIRALVRGFKPYKGGDDLLYALNALSNTNKHGIISPVAVASGGMTFNRVTFIGGKARIMSPIWDRTKNEMEMFRIPPGTYVDANLEVSNYIAIHGVEIVDGQPVLAVLDTLISKVEGIIMATEAEAKRIGLIP